MKNNHNKILVNEIFKLFNARRLPKPIEVIEKNVSFKIIFP